MLGFGLSPEKKPCVTRLFALIKRFRAQGVNLCKAPFV